MFPISGVCFRLREYVSDSGSMFPTSGTIVVRFREYASEFGRIMSDFGNFMSDFESIMSASRSKIFRCHIIFSCFKVCAAELPIYDDGARLPIYDRLRWIDDFP